jgi:hypothetical protein
MQGLTSKSQMSRLILGVFIVLLVVVLVDYCIHSFTPCIKENVGENIFVVIVHDVIPRWDSVDLELKFLKEIDAVGIRVRDVGLQDICEFPLQEVGTFADFSVFAELDTVFITDDDRGVWVAGFSVDCDLFLACYSFVLFQLKGVIGIDNRLFIGWSI